jgi:hypothetical protein
VELLHVIQKRRCSTWQTQAGPLDRLPVAAGALLHERPLHADGVLFDPPAAGEAPEPPCLWSFKLARPERDRVPDPVAQARQYVQHGHSVAKGYEDAHLAIHFHLRIAAGRADAEGVDLCAALYRAPKNLGVEAQVSERFAASNGDHFAPNVERGGRYRLKGAVLVVIPQVLKVRESDGPSPGESTLRGRVVPSVARLCPIDECPVSLANTAQLADLNLRRVPFLASPAAGERDPAAGDGATGVEEGQLECEVVERGAQVVDKVSDECRQDRIGMLNRPTAPPDVPLCLSVELTDAGYGFGVPIEIGSDLIVQRFEVLLSTT